MHLKWWQQRNGQWQGTIRPPDASPPRGPAPSPPSSAVAQLPPSLTTVAENVLAPLALQQQNQFTSTMNTVLGALQSNSQAQLTQLQQVMMDVLAQQQRASATLQQNQAHQAASLLQMIIQELRREPRGAAPTNPPKGLHDPDF